MNAANLSRLLTAKVDSAAGGDITAIAATTGKKIRVYAMDLKTASSTTVNIKSASTSLTGAMTLTSHQLPAMAVGDKLIPWYTCTVSEALVLTMGGAVQISGVILYTKD